MFEESKCCASALQEGADENGAIEVNRLERLVMKYFDMSNNELQSE